MVWTYIRCYEPDEGLVGLRSEPFGSGPAVHVGDADLLTNRDRREQSVRYFLRCFGTDSAHSNHVARVASTLNTQLKPSVLPARDIVSWEKVAL